MKCLMGAFEERGLIDMVDRVPHCPGAILKPKEKVLVNGFGEMQEDGTLIVSHLNLLHEECAGWWQGEAALSSLGPVLRENALGYIKVLEEFERLYKAPKPVISK